MASRRKITTTGPSKQIHTLYDKGYGEAAADRWGTKPTYRSGGHHVVDWRYHNIDSVHPIFHQAVENYARIPPGGYHTMYVDGIWPRRPDQGSDTVHWGGNPTS